LQRPSASVFLRPTSSAAGRCPRVAPGTT
jgi:hypothetical protein